MNDQAYAQLELLVENLLASTLPHRHCLFARYNVDIGAQWEALADAVGYERPEVTNP